MKACLCSIIVSASLLVTGCGRTPAAVPASPPASGSGSDNRQRQAGQPVVIAISPALPAAQRPVVHATTAQFLRSVPVNQKVSIFNGLTGEPITEVTMPALTYDTPRARAVQLAPQLQRLTSYLTNGPGSDSAIDLPRVLRQLENRGPLTLVVHGAAPGVTPAGTVDIPADGVIAGSAKASPYGTAERTNRLQGCTLIVSPVSHAMDQAVQDFVVKWGSQLGLRVAGFGLNLQQALDSSLNAVALPALAAPRLQLAAPPVPAAPPARAEAQPVNLLPAAGSGPVVVINNSSGQPTTIITNLTAANPLQLTETQRRSANTFVGIKWSAPVDLDLYVRDRRDEASQLCFKPSQQHTAIGTYHGDRRSATRGAELEYVSLEAGVRLDQLDVLINLFDGPALTEPLGGNVVVIHKGTQYVGNFILSPCQPTKGVGYPRNPSEPAAGWVRVNLQSIMRDGVVSMTAR